MPNSEKTQLGRYPDSYYIKEYYFTVDMDGDQADSNTSKYGFLVLRKDGSLAGISKFLYDNYDECDEALIFFFHNCYKPESKKKGYIFKVLTDVNCNDELPSDDTTCDSVYDYNYREYRPDDGYFLQQNLAKATNSTEMEAEPYSKVMYD